MNFVFVLLLISQQPSTQERIYHYSILAAGTAHIADIYTTGYCKGAGTCEEKNPILAPFQNNKLALSVTKGLLAGGLFIAIDRLLYRKGHEKLAITANVLTTILIGTVAVRNSRIE